jgi:AraC-like DNA-binding protein
MTDSWRDLVDAAVGPVDPYGVPDRVVAGAFGAVQVGELSQAEPGGARRTARHVRRSALETYKVDVIAHGRGVVEQDGRQAALGPGDLALVDLARPARWAMSPVRVVAVVFPAALLPLRRAEVAPLTAVTIAGDRGAGALASSFARQLPGHLDAPHRERLGTAMLDLLAVTLAARLDRAEVPPESRQRALVLRMRAFIEQHLGDPELTPRAIAATHHVSLRYLHRLFEAEQTTVAEWIRRQRLERCRRDLLDPALREQPVNAIAARWGLLNAAHFSRAFRAAYGASPREYRRLS